MTKGEHTYVHTVRTGQTLYPLATSLCEEIKVAVNYAKIDRVHKGRLEAGFQQFSLGQNF